MQKIKIIHLFIISSLLFLIYSFKTDTKKADITSQDIKNQPHSKKDCIIKEKCRECTFEELKSSVECQITGHKLLKHCTLYDDLKVIDDYYYNEHCNEVSKLNPVYYFLILNILLFLFSAYIRTAHKSAILSQTFEKLTILRKKA
jgi:hypothetical protein